MSTSINYDICFHMKVYLYLHAHCTHKTLHIVAVMLTTIAYDGSSVRLLHHDSVVAHFLIKFDIVVIVVWNAMTQLVLGEHIKLFSLTGGARVRDLVVCSLLRNG